jgi:acyl-coenzyme A thioesterase 13
MLFGKAAKMLSYLKQGTESLQFDANIFSNTTLLEGFNRGGKSTLLFSVSIKEELINYQESAHGGALSTIAESLTKIHASAADSRSRDSESTNLAISFMASVRAGELLQVYTTLDGISDQLAFTKAELYANNILIGRATQTWHFLDTGGR